MADKNEEIIDEKKLTEEKCWVYLVYVWPRWILNAQGDFQTDASKVVALSTNQLPTLRSSANHRSVWEHQFWI